VNIESPLIDKDHRFIKSKNYKCAFVAFIDILKKKGLLEEAGNNYDKQIVEVLNDLIIDLNFGKDAKSLRELRTKSAKHYQPYYERLITVMNHD